MKKLLTIFAAICLVLTLQAESPEKISYQAVIRNSTNALVTNQAIGLKVSILQTSATGTVVYAETHTPTTNINGLVTILIGAGNVVSGTFSGINWAAGPYFIKTEIDPAGGTAYSITSTSELLSVPYALYAKNTGSIPDNSVNSAKIIDGSVGTADLAPNSVTSPKIADGTIATADIADGAVTVAKLPAGATTTTYLRGDGMWATPAGSGGTSQWITSGNNIYYNTGKVGIGTATPTAYLHVKGTGAGGGSFTAEGLFKEKQDAPPVTGAGTRMMWYSDKAAFRAGEVAGTNWDKDSVGNHSVAMGYDVRAKGIASAAIGNQNKATGDYSLALGAASDASGTRSVAIGAGNTASSNWSTALGSYSTASGQYATALGYTNTAAGNYSMALGDNTTAYSMSETVVGSNNTSYTPASKTAWNPTDRLFVIGNGGDGVPRNAVTVLKNGNIGIGTDNPTAMLHTQTNANNGGYVLLEGSKEFVSGNLPEVSDPSNLRFLFYPDKAAFMSGYFQEDNWHKDSIGLYSFAMGFNAKATKDFCFAFGESSKATGLYSIAIGGLSRATNYSSIAIGGGLASGFQSFSLKGDALGSSSIALGGIASGFRSVAISGLATGQSSKAFGGKAESYYSTSMGTNNVGGGNPDKWIATDPLFEIGNSQDGNKPQNALTILKNGNTTINGDFRVEGNISSKGEKKTEVSVTVNTTINAGATTNISFTFPKAFSAVPMAYVGNITSGGGFAEVVMTLANVTTTGGKLFIYNPKSSSQSPNYTVKIIALGAE